MFKDFFLFEIKYRLRRPMIYVFLLINFLLIFFATISDNVSVGVGNEALNINAPQVIMSTALLMTLIGIFMTTAFMNTSILRDFEYKFDGILFSTPLTKAGYLGGRFAGAFLTALVPFIGVFAGIALGSVTPWVNAAEVGPFLFGPYWSAFLLGVVPNTFLIASLVFMMAALFRSSLFSFVGAIAVLVGYLIMISFSGSLENESLAILMDPLGVSSFSLITKYWTVGEKNTQWLFMNGPLLINRMIWLTVSIGLLLLTYFRFSFAPKKSIFSRKNKTASTAPTPYSPLPAKLSALPSVTIEDNALTSWKQFVHQAKMEFWGIVKSTPFIVLLSFGLINMMSAVPFVDESYGTGNHPVTYLMVDAIRGSFYLFLVGIIMYYAGVLIWRERDAKMNEFFDASPFATWIPLTSKLVALVGMTVIILVLAMFVGVGFQAINGYTDFELIIYLKEFLIYDLVGFIIGIILAMLVQTLVNNKYIGYFAFILLLILLEFGPGALNIKSNLVAFGATPAYIYSDMNGWSLFERGLNWFNAYWMIVGGILATTTILFWVRGKSLTIRQRLYIARQRFSGKLALVMLGLGALWVGTASFLFYQTKVVNTITADATFEQQQVDYELNYKQYQHIAQPRITAVDYEISIYPEERNFKVVAAVKGKNKTNETIDKIHFSLHEDLDVNINIAGANLEVDDKKLKYQIYELATPLAPGADFNFEVTIDYVSEGIENEITNKGILQNGTFLSNFKMMPVIGYSPQFELAGKKKRVEYNLPYKKRFDKLHAQCGHSCNNTYISSDSDWVNVTSTISTSSDQVAIAPGTLTKEWEADGRRFFKYELKKPVLNFYSFVSGKYEIKRDVWTAADGKQVDVEVYYHPGHDYNVDKMINSMKRSLSYYSQHYADYPHEQARIIEFPRYETFAQAFPGTMPYSESIGFIANLNEEHAIDMVYYIVAHEMAHQWWAHQVIGAEVQGATMLSESFSQYAALMVMQEEYGKDKMKQFLKYEMDRYLRSRGREQDKESPLMYNEGQDYIHYRKGSVVMYALQDYIGEDSLNMALRRYAEAVSYQEPPYTTTLDVMEYITAVTPDSLQYLLDDMFREIILYSNKTTEASYRSLNNGQYEVTVNVEVEKFAADTLGKETLIPHNDFIDIGIFSEEKEAGQKYGRPILVERKRISAPKTSFTFIVEELPYEAGIDPNYLLVDRFPEDNLKKCVEVE